jgi:hypothetical protein
MLLYAGANVKATTRLGFYTPLFLAGHAGGALKGNNHVRTADGTPTANALLTVMHTLGVDLPSLGDSTGELDLNGAAVQTTVAAKG